MDVGEMLIERYGAENVILQDNGFYHVCTTNKENCDEIISPQIINGETKLLCFLPGAAGSGGDAAPLREIMKKEDAPNCVVAISRISSDPNDIFEQATKVIEDNNGTISGVAVESFSAGGFNGYVVLDRYLERHPELGDKSLFLTIDGGWQGVKTKYKMELSDLKNLLKYNVPIIKQNTYRKLNNLAEAAAAGLNIVGLYGFEKKGNTEFHVLQNINALEAELGFYLLGVKDNINPGKDGKCFYTLYKYENNQLTDYNIYELRKYIINKKDSAFSSLTKLSALSLKKRNDGSSKVVSNLDFVIASMNSIRSDITSSSVLSIGTIEGSGEISSLIASNINKYYFDVGVALSKLEQETKSVASIGQATYDLDADLARQTDSFKIVGSIVDVDDINNKNPKDKTNNA